MERGNCSVLQGAASDASRSAEFAAIAANTARMIVEAEIDRLAKEPGSSPGHLSEVRTALRAIEADLQDIHDNATTVSNVVASEVGEVERKYVQLVG